MCFLALKNKTLLNFAQTMTFGALAMKLHSFPNSFLSDNLTSQNKLNNGSFDTNFRENSWVERKLLSSKVTYL